jgi:hypothetical protein
MVKFAEGKDGLRPFPLIFKNLGIGNNGLPWFREDVLGINDFPTAEDRAIGRSGVLFEKILKEKKIIYMAPGPSADFDNDGRLDLFLPNWWPESRSLLLRNETPGGNWLQIHIAASGGKGPASGGRQPPGVNSNGIGSRVTMYTAGKLGQADARLGCQGIAAGYGYASGQPAMAHFGLGTETSVDIEVTLPHGKGKVLRRGVKANQRLSISVE